MTIRLHPPQPICDDAEFDGDTHRIWLSRKIADSGPVGIIMGLNPSTAGAHNDDQTIRKEKEYARRWGWSGFWKINLFTVIETHSRKLGDFDFKTAVGFHGSDVIEACLPLVDGPIVVCWGAAVPKTMTHRIHSVCVRIRALKRPESPVLCFGTTKLGFPIHPSRLSYDTQLVPFELPGAQRPSLRDDE